MGELIRDLEAATEGGRELDHEILWATTGKRDVDIPEGRLTDNRVPLHYTTSLDAALTLVPEGVRAELIQSLEGGWWDAAVYEFGEDDNPIAETERGALTPALALCIAALKARQATSRAAATSGICSGKR